MNAIKRNRLFSNDISYNKFQRNYVETVCIFKARVYEYYLSILMRTKKNWI